MTSFVVYQNMACRVAARGCCVWRCQEPEGPVGSYQEEEIQTTRAMTREASLLNKRELVKALLFLRTASTAVSSLRQIVQGSKAFIDKTDLVDDHNYHRQLLQNLRDEENMLLIWDERLFGARLELIHLASKIAIGKQLPVEILTMIGSLMID